MKCKWPVLASDEEAKRFVEEADLTEYDFSEMIPVNFEFRKKEAALHMRLPEALLDAVKARAKSKGVPYSRYVRMVLEADIRHGQR